MCRPLSRRQRCSVFSGARVRPLCVCAVQRPPRPARSAAPRKVCGRTQKDTGNNARVPPGSALGWLHDSVGKETVPHTVTI